MANELIGTKWRYSVPSENSAYNDFYTGTWNVDDVRDNRVLLSQACTRHDGDCVFSTKKCTIVPMSKLNFEFKRARFQNIVVEEKPVSGNVSAGHGKVGPVQRYSPIMTNKDIQRSIDSRKNNAWTDDDIEKYLRSQHLGSSKTPQHVRCASAANRLSEAIDSLLSCEETNAGYQDEDSLRRTKEFVKNKRDVLDLLEELSRGIECLW